MNIIEEKIVEILDAKGASKVLSKTKQALNSSSKMNEVVKETSKNIKSSVKEGVGGISGRLMGALASTTTRAVGGLTAGVVSGTLKSIAFFIPDGADPKNGDNDSKIAYAIETLELPDDQEELFELLQWVHEQVNKKESKFGEHTIKSLKSIHPRIYEALTARVEDNKSMKKLIKSFAPSKRLGLF